MKEVNHVAKKSVWLVLDKHLYIFLICFFIATVFWLLLALSNEYNTTLSFPVTYINMPGKKVIMNELPAKISVSLKTTGFKILSFGLHKEQKPLEIDVAEKFANTKISTDFFALPTGFFLQDFSRKLGKDVTIVRFDPDSIVFNFSDIITRKIPVSYSYRADFEKQYDSTGNAFVSPAFIDVSGPPSIIQKLKYVYTKAIILTNVKAPVKQKVKLIPNHLLSYSTKEVEFRLPVEKFTEGIEEVEIHPVNVSQGYSLKTFPDKVKVRYLVAISNYNKVDASMFDAIVEGGEKEKKPGSKLGISLITTPSFIRITRLEPEKVDYILRKQ